MYVAVTGQPSRPLVYRLGMARTAALLLSAVLVACGPAAGPGPDPSHGFVITGSTLIDGSGAPPLPQAFVVIRAGRIADLGPQSHVSLPKGLPIVDARGMFIVPLVSGLVGEEAIAKLELQVRSGRSPQRAIASAVGEDSVVRKGGAANLLVLYRDPTLEIGHLAAAHAVVRDGRIEPPPGR
jgi:hypothetical protein